MFTFIDPSLARQIDHYLPAVFVAVLLWMVIFGQEIFRGRFSIRSLFVLMAMIAGALALSGRPVTGIA